MPTITSLFRLTTLLTLSWHTFCVQDIVEDECGFYLAPSTIPGGGLGTFAGKRFATGVPIGAPALIFPIVDTYLHHPEVEGSDTFFERYCWNQDTFAGLEDEGVFDSVALVPGVGAALNSMLPLQNVHGTGMKFSLENMHRSRDPGVGAFIEEIQVGAELFDSYGEDYFIHREHIYGMIPLEADFESADEFIDSFVGLREDLCIVFEVCNVTGGNGRSIYLDLFDLLMGKLASVWLSRTLNALPRDLQIVDVVAYHGTSLKDYNESVRTLEWLESNGVCADNLFIGKSQIKQAGRGAFAKRLISKGTIVTPAPLLHMRKSFLEMHPVNVDEYGAYTVDTGAPFNHYQLILNYCFGHPQSTISLCSYSFDSTLINHSNNAANAQLEWNHKLSLHPDWFEQPPSLWVDTLSTGITLNYVATRDIYPGEEVLIDYGDEWEAAWTQHVAKWVPPPGASAYISAFELNERERIPTIRENEHHSEEHVDLLCRAIYRKWFGLMTAKEEQEKKAEDESYDIYREKNYCRAVDRTDVQGEEMYTVEYYSREVFESTSIYSVYAVLFFLPRDVFVYQDKPYSRDHAQPWSFRHDLKIPDDIMPDVWKDLL